MATIIDIADAVVAELNGSSFSQPFTAERHYQPKFELPEMAALHVSVVPHGLSSKTLDRGRDTFEYQIDVAVQQKTDMSSETLDALMGLVEQIADHFRQQPLASYPNARCMDVANDPAYSQQHMEEFRQFTSVLSLNFRMAR